MSEAGGTGEEIHAAYRRLIESREVRRLAARFGLDRGIRYELVDVRRSFHGKAGIIEGLGIVRLPCNPRPEAYLLLTLLHEWAHLLAQRQAKGRRIQPHGSEWRRHYASLIQAAVKAHLFPGNEQEVLRHAAAGEAQTRHAQLRGPDGNLLAPPPERPAPAFRSGDAVQFTDRGGQVIQGTVRRVNSRTYTVTDAEAGLTYHVPIAYPALAPAGEAMPAPAEDAPWRLGVAVEFTDPAGECHRGHVIRVNRRTLTVRTEAGQEYRVGYGYPSLRRLSA